MGKIKQGAMTTELIAQIQLHLKAPLVALERLAREGPLPQIFAEAGLEELKKVRDLVDRFARESGHV
jgi:hypothetical protein